MAELKMLFGSMLKMHRNKRGLSQAELAQRADRSLETISRLERGENAPSFDTIEQLALVLDIPPVSFFGIETAGDSKGRLTNILIKLAALDDANLAWIDRLIADALAKPN